MIILLYVALAFLFLTVGLSVIAAAGQLIIRTVYISFFVIIYTITGFPLIIYSILIYFKELWIFTKKLFTLQFFKRKKDEISNIPE